MSPLCSMNPFSLSHVGCASPRTSAELLQGGTDVSVCAGQKVLLVKHAVRAGPALAESLPLCAGVSEGRLRGAPGRLHLCRWAAAPGP